MGRAKVVHIGPGARDRDQQAGADLDALQLARLDEAAHRAGVDAAELAGGLVQGPEEGIGHGRGAQKGMSSSKSVGGAAGGAGGWR